MPKTVTAESLHRTAKYFMDSGQARSHGEAMAMLRRFGLNIVVGPEVHASRDHQIALLTLVNAARRTFWQAFASWDSPMPNCWRRWPM